MATKNEEYELELLLDVILHCYGYDFRNYSRASLKRRIMHRFGLSGLKYISEMIPKVIHDKEFFNMLLMDLSITVTEIFRDPHVYKAIKAIVIPKLKTYPFVKIWHAGCATGEEVYSMAIVLKEEGFLDKVQIYATDFNNHSLEIAKEGIYSLSEIQKFTKNYNKFGGVASFSDYYYAKYQSAKIHDFLKEKIIFSHHNLVTDSVFGEMNLILCRNVLIYFNKTLQNRVLNLFFESLAHRGFLCLGSKESLDFSSVCKQFETLAKKEKLYRRK